MPSLSSLSSLSLKMLRLHCRGDWFSTSHEDIAVVLDHVRNSLMRQRSCLL